MPSEDVVEADAPVDEARSALLEALTAELGDAIVGQHLLPGRDLWIRVTRESWAHTAEYLRERQRFRFFNWLSAIDWMPSPYGRSLDATVDSVLEGSGLPVVDTARPAEGWTTGYAGGDTRFQVLARVHSLSTNLGVTVKADIPDDDLSVDSWAEVYPGADWHERETWEMFGITFVGHPGLRNIYLPSGFEGHPLRKDYPLVSRLIKPWPGIVDVELMPEADDPEASPSTENPADTPTDGETGAATVGTAVPGETLPEAEGTAGDGTDSAPPSADPAASGDEGAAS